MNETAEKELKELKKAYPDKYKNRFQVEGLDDDYIRYYYDGLLGSGKEYDMCIYDMDEIAWLNTLLGYQLPWQDALELNHECWELNDEISVLELGAKHKKLVKKAAKRLNLQIDFSKWVTKKTKTVRYSFDAV